MMRAPHIENVSPEPGRYAAPHPWDAAAKGWNQNAALIRAWLHDATAAMLEAARITRGARVLDIAAGAGDQTLDIARSVGAGGYVLATDISASILALAQQNALTAGFQNVHTQVADAQTLDVPDASFDAAVCRLGLMFCQNPQAAMQHARMALQRGGYFSALVFAAPVHNPCLTISLATARKHADMAAQLPLKNGNSCPPGTLMSLGDPKLLAQLLAAAGFADIEMRAVAAPFCLPDVTHYVEFLRTSASPLMEILSPLSPAAQQDAWDDIAEQLDVFKTESGWIGPNKLLLCSARAQ
jgi:ubiquinone/menaquinone biosynthesis C-methylase UbiE